MRILLLVVLIGCAPHDQGGDLEAAETSPPMEFAVLDTAPSDDEIDAEPGESDLYSCTHGDHVHLGRGECVDLQLQLLREQLEARGPK